MTGTQQHQSPPPGLCPRALPVRRGQQHPGQGRTRLRSSRLLTPSTAGGGRGILAFSQQLRLSTTTCLSLRPAHLPAPRARREAGAGLTAEGPRPPLRSAPAAPRRELPGAPTARRDALLRDSSATRACRQTDRRARWPVTSWISWVEEPIARPSGRRGGTSGAQRGGGGGEGRAAPCRGSGGRGAQRGGGAIAMPGIDKLPIEETLEDSPQVREAGRSPRVAARAGPARGRRA